jgi:hypothetical protein
MHTLLGNRLNTCAGAPKTPPPRLPHLAGGVGSYDLNRAELSDS